VDMLGEFLKVGDRVAFKPSFSHTMVVGVIGSIQGINCIVEGVLVQMTKTVKLYAQGE